MITLDGSLYWFQYNKVVDSVRVNILVVVTSSGEVAFEETMSVGGDIKFVREDKEYVITIKEPQKPG